MWDSHLWNKGTRPLGPQFVMESCQLPVGFCELPLMYFFCSLQSVSHDQRATFANVCVH